ncbi:Mov34/MPN/PAD-1 family protein [Burkholderia latens]|uniref:Mov34/MPN/PAD-1 family protein n=1 Tax=Burkholderia latens TaxID=488446 RepID=UPI001AE3B2CF|nr:Mov34/MPN/PAD-1 family protein [Burkholderia latens]QTO45993.1 Mov34/MPN/PAD-1 family protein [Burkholderia latens]
MMRYAIPGAAWELVLDDEVIETLRSRVQVDRCSSESVGQLYASSLSSKEVTICIATALRPKYAYRTRVVIEKALADEERATMFERGMHCAGVWHTHPQLHPSPSSDDHGLAEDYAQAASDAGLAGVVFIIVGTGTFPAGLYVGVHDGKIMHRAAICEP